MIRVCGEHGLEAGRMAGFSGTWITDRERGPEKIGAIGVRISRWITSHGFAFNVSTDLEFFKLIVPCGIEDHGVTSLEAATGGPVTIADVEDHLVRQFCAVFGRQIVSATVTT
jgi:lipoyl(octanoyl) transferase